MFISGNGNGNGGLYGGITRMTKKSGDFCFCFSGYFLSAKNDNVNYFFAINLLLL